MRFTIVALALCALPAVLPAHHSRVEFDTSTVFEIEGELTDVRWRLPHPTFTLVVEDSNGDAQSWELEGSGVYSLERSGIDEDAFPVGERVRVAGWRSTRRPLALFATNMLLPNGAELVLLQGETITSRWSDEYAGGRWLGDPVSAGERSIFRVWSAESREVFFEASLGIEIQLTTEAESKMADPVDFDPCVAQGMPSTMVNPLPIELIDRGDHIDLQLTTFGVLRRIDMTGDPVADAVPATDLGYSTGRWVDDTLEVRTTRVSWPYFDDAGTPQTENVEILERFTVSADGDRLEYSMTVTDPASFVEPVNLSWYWIDIGEEMVPLQLCPDAG